MNSNNTTAQAETTQSNSHWYKTLSLKVKLHLWFISHGFLTLIFCKLVFSVLGFLMAFLTCLVFLPGYYFMVRLLTLNGYKRPNSLSNGLWINLPVLIYAVFIGGVLCIQEGALKSVDATNLISVGLVSSLIVLLSFSVCNFSRQEEAVAIDQYFERTTLAKNEIFYLAEDEFETFYEYGRIN